MPDTKVNRDLHRAVVETLRDFGPLTMEEISVRTGYHSRTIRDHIKANMELSKSKAERPGASRKLDVYDLTPRTRKLIKDKQESSLPDIAESSNA